MVETKIRHHIHTVFDGTRTSQDIADMNNPTEHFHEVKGERTSIEPYGPEQRHKFQGELTSVPMFIDDEDPMSDEDPDDEETIDTGIAGIHDEDPNEPPGKVDSDKSSHQNMEVKCIGGMITEVKEEAVNGVPVGIVMGYIATWDLDRGNDRFSKGAFEDSLIELRTLNRPIRFKDHHFRTIGGFPIDRVHEDEKGLFGVGNINLDVQQGRELFALAKQGIITDFSIGFSPVEFEMDGDIRIIHKAIVWEGSLVDEPMNTAATVTEVKAVVPFQDLPLADQSRQWDSTAAKTRVREITDSDEEPTAAYRKAFVWFDAAESNLFSAYKLPIADIINGQMMAVPRGIFAAAGALLGARGGVDIPDVDRPKAIRHLERYYAKMDLESPFKEKQFFVATDVKEWGARDIEKFLKETEGMSNRAAKTLSVRLDKHIPPEDNKLDEDWSPVLKEINRTNKNENWSEVLNEIKQMSH